MLLITSNNRGFFANDWLQSYHSFSFANYYNPHAMNYASLRVVNDDIIAPHRGFDTHFHRDMEIITYVVEGAITHRDNLGNNYEITAGNLQIMSAGSGIHHSEFNLRDNNCRIIQTWVKPNVLNIAPRHELITNNDIDKFVLIASCDDDKRVTKIFASAEIYVLEARNISEINLPNSNLEKLWIQVVCGEIMLENKDFSTNFYEGDGVGIDTKLVKNSIIKIKNNSKNGVKILLFFLN